MVRTRLDPHVELASFELDPASIRLLPLGLAAEGGVVVLGKVDRRGNDPVRLGMVDPADAALISALETRLARSIEPVQLTRYEVLHALDVGFGGGASGIAPDHAVDVRGAAPGPDATAPEILDDLPAQGLIRGASDIHIESYPHDVDVRLRIDGVLHQLNHPVTPINSREVVSRIKVISGAHVPVIRTELRRRGRRNLLEDALDKVRAGIISLEEVFRVIPYRQLRSQALEARDQTTP